MAAELSRSERVRKVAEGLRWGAVKIVVDHLTGRPRAESFNVLLAELRQTFPGLPAGVLRSACEQIDAAEQSAWFDALAHRILECGDVRLAMTQPTPAHDHDEASDDGSSFGDPLPSHILITGEVVGWSRDPDRTSDRWFTAEKVDDDGARYRFWEGDRYDLAQEAAIFWAASHDLPIVDESGVTDDGARL